MPSQVAVIGLSWDGYDLQRADLDVMFTILEGLDNLPNVRGDDQLIPFRTGLRPSPRTANNRAIVAGGWITGHAPTPATMYRAYLDQLKARLDPTGPPRVLVATLEDGSKRWITCVPRNIIPAGDGLGSDFRNFSIEWDALDPYWYGNWGTLLLDSGLFLDSGRFLDSGAELVILGTGTVDIDTLSTAAVERIRVVITGPSTGPVGLETISGTPVGFTINRTLVAGEVLEVDNIDRTVLLDGISLRNLMTLSSGNQHGEYIRLPAGPVTLRATGGATETRIFLNATYQ